MEVKEEVKMEDISLRSWTTLYSLRMVLFYLTPALTPMSIINSHFNSQLIKL